MLIISFKLLLVGFLMLPVAFAAMAAGILFASYNLALSRNPQEKDNLFSATIMWFGFIESFIFIGLLFTTIALLVF